MVPFSENKMNQHGEMNTCFKANFQMVSCFHGFSEKNNLNQHLYNMNTWNL